MPNEKIFHHSGNIEKKSFCRPHKRRKSKKKNQHFLCKVISYNTSRDQITPKQQSKVLKNEISINEDIMILGK